MAMRDALEKALSGPTPEDLWRLRGELLEGGIPADASIWRVLDEFQRFLDHLASGATSRQYSSLASKLDISALGCVVCEKVFEESGRDELAQRLLSAVLSEGLMILATRQHVKAWEAELSSVHREAAWYLYHELWRWAESRKPELPARERRLLLDRVFTPLRDPNANGFSTALLLGLLFQLLLVSRLVEDLDRLAAAQRA